MEESISGSVLGLFIYGTPPHRSSSCAMVTHFEAQVHTTKPRGAFEIPQNLMEKDVERRVPLAEALQKS